MKTRLTATVRELTTDWNETTVARLERINRTWCLTDLFGKEIARCNSLDAAAEAARQWAKEQGYIHGAAISAA